MKRILLSLSLVLSSLSSHASVITLDDPDPATNLIGVTAADAPLGDGYWSNANLNKSFTYLYWNTTSVEYTLGDLVSLSFDSLRSGTNNDFYISIYTAPDGTNDYGWYGQRLNFEPLYAKNRNAPEGQWNSWSTDEGVNQLLVSDYITAGGYTAPTLAELLDENYQDNPSYSFSDVDYSSEAIFAIALSTGSGWSETFQGAVDNIVFDFGQKGTLAFDLEAEPVPAPSSLGILALSMLGVLRIRRYRYNVK